jgi:hypothetical protein
MQHPQHRDSKAGAPGSADEDDFDSWPLSEPSAASPFKFDSTPAIVDAAIAKARAQPASERSFSAHEQTSEPTPQPMSERAAKWPGYYPEFAIRSALFGCARTGAAAATPARSIKIAGRSGETVTLSTSGPMLTMADKDVWEIALDIAREREAPFGRTFEAPLAEFARRMGRRSASGPAGAKIRASLERLAACSVDLVDGSAMASGRMLASVDASGPALRIELDPGLVEPALCSTKLFKIDSARRRSLSKSSLARWLHDFLSTHQTAQAVDLAYLREMCGHGGSRSEFPAALRLALSEIQALGDGPETRPLAKSCPIDPATRSSAEWTLICEPGLDKPKFKMPASSATRRAAL